MLQKPMIIYKYKNANQLNNWIKLSIFLKNLTKYTVILVKIKINLIFNLHLDISQEKHDWIR